MNGFFLAIVKENYDKDYPGMVKVVYPSFSKDSDESFWARVITPYAGMGYGSYFMPEIGDAVVVGFLHSDMQSPIIIGNIWAGENPFPSETVTEKNEKKAISTKGGHKVVFTDGEDGGIIVQTKSGQTVSISDKDKLITISTIDKKCEIALDNNKKILSITSDDKIEIKGKEISIDGKLSVKGTDISIKADSGVDLEGKTLKVTGNSTKIGGDKIDVVGNGPVKVESTAMLTLKGSITKIN